MSELFVRGYIMGQQQGFVYPSASAHTHTVFAAEDQVADGRSRVNMSAVTS